MELILTILAYVTSAILVTITIPPIIRVANAKHLFDHVNERKIHKKIVPPLGGVAIFLGVTLSSMIWTYGKTNGELKYIVASVIIMFFIGLKDDLMDISARKKLIVQIVAALIVITFGSIRFTNLHGIFGLNEIGLGWSIAISLFIMIVIINAFNLIDGIDGLASGLAILSSTLLGFWFYRAGFGVFAVLSFALAGSLSGFFFFNVFGDKHKLFMGDTGSLVIGLVIGALIIKFNEVNINYTGINSIKAAPSLSFALIGVPLVDTLRVMTIRLLQKKSPFSADNNHVHHNLLYFTKKHIVVTLILVLCNLSLIVFAYHLGKTRLNLTHQFLLVVLLSIAMLNVPALLKKLIAMKKNAADLKPVRSIFTRIFF